MDKIKKIVWKDKSKNILIGFIIIFSLLIIFIYAYIIEKNLFNIIVILLFIFCILVLLTRKFIYINNQGIRLGNMPLKNSFFKIKSRFFKWNQIDKIKIIGKMKYGWAVSIPHNYLIIKNKNDGSNYSCEIFNYKDFIKTLKKLNKAHLLDKNSKYLKDKKR